MRRGNTRSHSELGSKVLQRQWYFVLRRGRVGRCQADKFIFKPRFKIFFAASGVIETLFSRLLFSFIEPTITVLMIYRRVRAKTISNIITNVVPKKTNLVKLFHVFLCSSLLSIRLTLPSFVSWIFFIYNVNFSSTFYNFRV